MENTQEIPMEELDQALRLIRRLIKKFDK
jgi:hypothetical protein